jgi:hypothetical protein
MGFDNIMSKGRPLSKTLQGLGSGGCPGDGEHAVRSRWPGGVEAVQDLELGEVDEQHDKVPCESRLLSRALGHHVHGGLDDIESDKARGEADILAEIDKRACRDLKLLHIPQSSMLKFVEAEVEEAERREAKHDIGECVDEAVVTEVELVEEAQTMERVREHAT